MSESPEPTFQPRPEFTKAEEFWRDHRQWLNDLGYELRARYHPGWIPSWVKDPTIDGFAQEDGKVGLSAGMDVTRISDGKVFYLKRAFDTEAKNEEAVMKLLFSTPERASDPKNHCSPLLDVWHPEEDPTVSVFLLPYFALHYCPHFFTIAEIVDMFQQLIEGLEFMHEQRVAHCDIKWDNIMVDSLHLYKERPHPGTISLQMSMDMKSPSRHTTRTRHPVKYYYIDFGLSRSFGPDEEPLMRSGIGGVSVPEFKTTKWCNAYAVDIYCLGHFFRSRFTQAFRGYAGYAGLEFMDPLIDEMVREDPSQRPTIHEVASKFDAIRKTVSRRMLRARPRKTTELAPVSFFRDIAHLWRTYIRPGKYRSSPAA